MIATNPEEQITALVSMLEDDLPAYLDAIDAEYGDAIVLDDLARVYFAPMERYDKLPAAVVAADLTQYPDEYRSDTIRQQILQIQVHIETNERLTIGGRELIPQEVVAIRLYRTMTAIHQMILANPKLEVSGTQYASYTLISEIAYSAFGEYDRGAFRFAVMALLVHIED